MDVPKHLQKRISHSEAPKGFRIAGVTVRLARPTEYLLWNALMNE